MLKSLRLSFLLFVAFMTSIGPALAVTLGSTGGGGDDVNGANGASYNTGTSAVSTAGAGQADSNGSSTGGNAGSNNPATAGTAGSNGGTSGLTFGGSGGGGGTNSSGATSITTSYTGGAGGHGGSGDTASGGAGGGGDGLISTSSSNVSISAAITGGAGGDGAHSDFDDSGGGGGGAGLVVVSSPSVSISSTITGGAGGSGGNSGGGGAGVILLNSTELTLTSGNSIIGGASNGNANGSNSAGGTGSGGAAASTGGVGIIAAGGSTSIINNGTIAGGLGGSVQADAIDFSGNNNSLTIAPGSTITGNVTNAGSSGNTLILGGTTNSSFDISTIGPSAQYEGFNAYTVDTTATWTFTGTSVISTPWTVSSGTLLVGDSANPSTSLEGNVTVASGGTLSGYGTIIGNINNAGTVRPGSSIGTLTVTGNYTGAGGGLVIELNPTTTSLLKVSGTAALNGGALTITPDAGTYTHGASYTILTAGGGVTGTFGSVIDNSSTLFRVNYGADDVILTVGTAFAANGANADQTRVGAMLDGLSPTGGISATINKLAGLSAAEQQQALAQLPSYAAPGVLTGAGGTNMRAMFGGILSHLQGTTSGSNMMLSSDIGNPNAIQVADASGTYWGPDTSAISDYTAWVQGFGDFSTLGSDATGPGMSSQTGGGMFGIERHPTHQDTIGFTGGFSRDNVSIDSANQSATQTTYAAGVYGRHEWENWVADAAALAGYNDAKTQRFNSTFGEQANGSTAGYGLGLDGGIGYRLPLDPETDTVLTPRLGLTYTYSYEDGYTESGAPNLNLAVGNSDQNRVQTSLGATLATKMTIARDDGSLDVVRPDVSLGWKHEWLNPAAEATESFAGVAGSSFTTTTANPGRDAAVVGLGASYTPGSDKALAFYARYDGDFSSNQSDNAVTAGFKYSW